MSPILCVPLRPLWLWFLPVVMVFYAIARRFAKNGTMTRATDSSFKRSAGVKSGPAIAGRGPLREI